MTIGVFVAARIIKRTDRQKVALWTPDRPFLSSVEVTVGLSQNGLIRATLEAPYAEGIKLLEEPDLIVQSNVLQVRMGYSGTGHMTPWYSGLITTPGAQIDPNGVTITLEAHGGAAVAVTRQTTGSFNKKRSEIVREVAELYGWDIVPADFDTDPELSKVVNIQGAGRSVWLLLSEVLEQAGYDFYMGTDDRGKAVLNVLKKSEWFGGSMKRSFVMYGNVDLAQNQYPLLSFSAETPAVFLWPGSDGLKNVLFDENGNEVVVQASENTSSVPSVGGQELATSGKSDEKDPDTNLKQDTLPAEGFGQSMIPALPVPAQDTQAALQATFDRFHADGFEIEGTSIGVPLMRPGEIIGIYGVSKLYNGLYGVFEVTHSVGSDGFETSWKARRNAIPSGYGVRGATIVSPENRRTTVENPNESGAS